jgi:hypothetical protein
MQATINWQVQWMKSSTQVINGFNQVVLTAGWICNGSQEDNGQTYTGSVYSTSSFSPPPEGDPNFVPYDSLTQNDVLGWIWASGVDKDAAEQAVQQQINLAINPPEAQLPLPWAQA